MASKEAVKQIQKITRKQNLVITRDDVKIIIGYKGGGYSVYYKTESGRESLSNEGRAGVLKLIDSGINDSDATITTQATGYSD